VATESSGQHRSGRVAVSRAVRLAHPIALGLTEIQKRKIGGIYNINVSSTPYCDASSGSWYLIVNQVGLHDDDPIRKISLDKESQSEKQWRHSLLEIERDLQDKYDFKDINIQPPVAKSFDRATVRKIVEDHWRARLPLRGYGVQTHEEVRTSISEGERDPVAYARRLGVLSDPPPVAKSFDRDTARKLVEDHFRAILPLRGYGKRPQNMALIEQMGSRFADQIDAWGASMPPDQAKELGDMFGDAMQLSVAECQRDPVAYARRLGVLPGRTSNRQGIGEMAVRTAVRASIWEGVARLFGR
jgi:hypothetical protein